MSQKIYLSMGSNLGDRERHLCRALELLQTRIRVSAISSVYETDPVGVLDQPAFLNIALAGDTPMDPHAALQVVKGVEETVGRRPTFRWGPRVVDIDLLLLGNQISKTDDLEIPHPRMHERAFVLIPLAEIAPGLRHPVLGQTMTDLARDVEGRAGVRPYQSPNRSSRQGLASE